MINTAKVIKISNEIEEEINIIVNGVEVTAFGGYIPYFIEVGNEYPVEVNLFADDFILMPNCNNEKLILRSGSSFEYTLMGCLNEKGQFDVGFLIEDEYLKTQKYLYGEYFALKVERLDVDFL